MGGDVFAAHAIYNQLRTYSGKVTVLIDSIAASAASIVAERGVGGVPGADHRPGAIVSLMTLVIVVGWLLVIALVFGVLLLMKYVFLTA